MLSQVYPHPVRLSTGAGACIDFTVGRDCHVALRLYDMLGRCVAVLHDGTVVAGRHTVAIPSGPQRANLVPGMYFCRMDAEGASTVRRMLVTW
jgi:hypothetical protein